MIFSFGQSERERLAVEVRDYECDNWVTSEVTVFAGGFQGKFKASVIGFT